MMNSATSIKRSSGHAGKAKADAVAEPAEKDRFKPWHFFVMLSLVGATAAVIMARQPSPEHLVLMSIAIGAAGVCAAALYATLAPLVRKEAAVGAPLLSSRGRAVLEREKMLVLRSIKELEFDRAMGKMSAADFDEMAGRLRARALSLMKQLDSATPGYQAIIERELAARLERQSPQAQTCSCGTANDMDATFCKRCGTRLAPERGDGLPAEAPARLRQGYGGQPSLDTGAKVGVEPADQPPPRLRSAAASAKAEGRPPSESEHGWGPTSTKK